MVTTLRAVQANFDLSEEKPQKMNNSKNEAVVAPIIPQHLPPLTLASLLMVQHREVEVMLWVKLEATCTEYLDGKALDSQ